MSDPKKSKPNRPLTKKEAIVVKKYVNSNISQRQAVLETYDTTEARASTLASQVFQRPVVRSAIAAEIERQVPSIRTSMARRFEQIIETGSDKDALAAMKLFGEWTGDSPGKATEKITRIFKQSLPSDAGPPPVEGEATEVKEEEEEGSQEVTVEQDNDVGHEPSED